MGTDEFIGSPTTTTVPLIDLALNRAHTRRVNIGSYYTNGDQTAQVVKTYELGHVVLEDIATAEMFGLGIVAFRREWWRIR